MISNILVESLLRIDLTIFNISEFIDKCFLVFVNLNVKLW